MATKDENILFLKKCINSLINQTFQDFQVFVIIDSNKDKNFLYLDSLNNQNDKINLLINDNKPGVSSSRNYGIVNSQSKYIAIVDSDDFYHPDKFKKQIMFLEDNIRTSVIGTNLYLVSLKDKIIGERTYPELNSEIRKNFLFKMPIANSSVMFKRNDLNDVGLFDENLNKAEDLELWLRFLSHHKEMHNIQEKLVYYRTPDDENFKRGREHYRNYFFVMKKHSKSIWPFRLRIVALVFFYIIHLIPDRYLSILLKTRIVHYIKKIKSKNIS
tara:strand:+ start:37661 stop:38476 length:816 start_codon:yes stop_codon:yes gene_type:complete